MRKTVLNPEKILDEYILDVIQRNNAMKEFQNSLVEQCKKHPIEDLKSRLKSNMDDERAYQKIDDTNRKPYNDFSLLQKEIAREVIVNNYPEGKRIRKITKNIINNIDSSKSFSKEQKTLKKELVARLANLKLDKEVARRKDNPEYRYYEKKTYISLLTQRLTNVYNRQVVQKEFNEINSANKTFDPTKDKGSCTKSLTISLFKLQEKYGIPIFDELKNIEDIAHPKDLSQKLSKYVRTANTGNLEDLNLKKGDIILLTRQSTKEPGHAMMCHGFDENNEPLLLGFSGVDKDVKANKDRRGDPRKGIIIDVNSLIKDSIKQKEQTLSPQSLNKDNQR